MRIDDGEMGETNSVRGHAGLYSALRAKESFPARPRNICTDYIGRKTTSICGAEWDEILSSDIALRERGGDERCLASMSAFIAR